MTSRPATVVVVALGLTTSSARTTGTLPAPILVTVTPEQTPVPDAPPPQVRTAGALVTLQALIAIGFAVLLGVQASEADLPLGAVIGEAGYFVVIGLALLAVGIGLLTGRRWARTPAIVTQLLLLPVVYSLIGPSQQLVLGIIAGVYVVATFLLLISERSRVWSMGLDLPDRPR
jgi:hypothetical protein